MAKENNLNFVEFYNLDNLKDFFINKYNYKDND